MLSDLHSVPRWMFSTSPALNDLLNYDMTYGAGFSGGIFHDERLLYNSSIHLHESFNHEANRILVGGLMCLTLTHLYSSLWCATMHIRAERT